MAYNDLVVQLKDIRKMGKIYYDMARHGGKSWNTRPIWSTREQGIFILGTYRAQDCSKKPLAKYPPSTKLTMFAKGHFTKEAMDEIVDGI